MKQYHEPLMTAEGALELLSLFDMHHIEVIVDGGWAVDALLGEQTRRHVDLDIAIALQFVPSVRILLAGLGYTDILLEDTSEFNFVLGDKHGRRVDIHIYAFDEQGNLVYGLPYPFESLQGHGNILGYPVRCITPEWLVKFHTGYPLDEKDLQDVRAICMRFGIKMPDEYGRFADKKGE
ncbi:MAG TPA: hypothetical protein VLD65_06960 [Anaerolineales bacterium]|nr:hypothetical protein [Anaerolineales bacterium]